MSVVINEFEVIPAETEKAPPGPATEGAPPEASEALIAQQVEQALRIRGARAERLRAY